MAERETTEQRYLHAMYDALRWIEREGNEPSTAAAILRGVLRGADYPTPGADLGPTTSTQPPEQAGGKG